MGQAIIILGMYRIAHNLAHDMHSKLKHWEAFHKDLQQLERLKETLQA